MPQFENCALALQDIWTESGDLCAMEPLCAVGSLIGPDHGLDRSEAGFGG